jgi:hypothetical protein
MSHAQLPTTLLAEVYTTPSAPQNQGALRPTYGISMHFLYVLTSLTSLTARKKHNMLWPRSCQQKCDMQLHATTVRAMGQSTTNITIGLGTPQCR